MPVDPLEKVLERKFFTTIRALGGIAVKIIPTTAGPPDRLVILNGRMFLVELKRESGELSRIQEIWHARSAERGVPVHVVYGREGMRAWLTAVVELDAPRPGRRLAYPCAYTLDRTVWRGLPEEYGEHSA